MKTLYKTLFAVLFSAPAWGQITLLPAFHEPSAGETQGMSLYDTASAVNNGSGPAMMWDFSAWQKKATAAINTSFKNVASVSSATMFPDATVAATNDNSNYAFFKSSTATYSLFEMVGMYGAASTMSLSNPKTIYQWPITYNTSFTDSYAGTMMTGSVQANVTGTMVTFAPGNGTLTLPGGAVYNDVLQVKSTDNMLVTTTDSTAKTYTVMTMISKYFDATQKYPLVEVDYVSMKMTDTTAAVTTASVMVNSNVAVGINDINLNATFAIFPNPARDHFSVNLSNERNDRCTVEIFTSLGQLVKHEDLGDATAISKNVSIAELRTGLYIVKTTIGNRASARRLIVE